MPAGARICYRGYNLSPSFDIWLQYTEEEGGVAKMERSVVAVFNLHFVIHTFTFLSHKLRRTFT